MYSYWLFFCIKMVVGFNVQHVFKFPVDIVIKTYINQINKNVNSQNLSEIQLNKDGKLKRISIMNNKFGEHAEKFGR